MIPGSGAGWPTPESCGGPSISRCAKSSETFRFSNWVPSGRVCCADAVSGDGDDEVKLMGCEAEPSGVSEEVRSGVPLKVLDTPIS